MFSHPKPTTNMHKLLDAATALLQRRSHAIALRQGIFDQLLAKNTLACGADAVDWCQFACTLARSPLDGSDASERLFRHHIVAALLRTACSAFRDDALTFLSPLFLCSLVPADLGSADAVDAISLLAAALKALYAHSNADDKARLESIARLLPIQLAFSKSTLMLPYPPLDIPPIAVRRACLELFDAFPFACPTDDKCRGDILVRWLSVLSADAANESLISLHVNVICHDWYSTVAAVERPNSHPVVLQRIRTTLASACIFLTGAPLFGSTDSAKQTDFDGSALYWLAERSPPTVLEQCSVFVAQLGSRVRPDAMSLVLQRILNWPQRRRVVRWTLAAIDGMERIGEVAAAAINASSSAAVSASGAFPMMTADPRQVRANFDMMAVNLLTEVTDSSALSLLRRWRRNAERESVVLLLRRLLLGSPFVDASTFHQQLLPVFDSILADVFAKSQLPADSSTKSASIASLADLFFALIHRHPGHPELYSPILRLLRQLNVQSPGEAELVRMIDAAKWLKWGSTDASFPAYNRSTAVVSSRASKSSEMVDSVGTGTRTGTFAGLLNRGNKCYQNAFLQALLVSDDYRTLLLGRTKAPLSDTSTAASNLTAGLGLVLSRLETSPHAVVDPFPLIRLLPAQFSGTSQEDAAEFGRFVIDQVHEHFRKTVPSVGVGNSSSASATEAANPVERALQLVDPSFGGVFQSVIKCQTCQFKSISHDPFTELSLSFDSNIGTTVPLLLQRFLADENLTGADAFLCSQCQTKQPATRCTRLIHSPSQLIVCLKQFEFNVQTMTRSKLSVPVAFDQVLDVPVISTDGIPSSARYSLYAVVIHSGTSALHGHYYTCGRHSNPNNAPWYLFNDSSVTSTSFDAIQQLSLNFRNDVPYLLFYHRL